MMTAPANCRVAKKLKLQERRAVIPSRRSLAACRPLGFWGDQGRPRGSAGTQGGLMEWARILAYITGTVDHELLLRNEYLAAENRILRGQLKGRLKFSDAERAKLGEIGRRLGRKALGEVATAALPDTILAWYRRLVARKFDGSQKRRTPGRPRINREVEELIVRMAEENRSWGYDRIVGALANLGHEVSDQTVGNVLRRHGLPPAPERKHTTTWAAFIRAHLAVLAGTDFFTVEVLTLRGLMTYYVLFFIHLESRKVDIAGITVHPNERWMQQMARNVRVRPISSSRITEFSQHEANGCEAQEDQAAEVEIFPVLGKPAATIEPRNGALDDPSARQNDEAFGPIGTPDDFGFELRSDLGQRRMEDRPRIGAVGKEPFQKRKQAEKRGQQQDAAVAILNIGRMNNRVQQQTLCIYQDVPLLALDELARVESGRIDARSAFFSAFHTLAVDDGGGGTDFASRLLATLLVKRVVDAIQGAVVPPQTEVPIHGAARRQVLGDVAPLASRAQHVHDAVDDIPRLNFTLAAPALRRRNERPDMRPFFVRHIARISQMIALVARPVLARPHRQPSSQAADV